MDTEFRIEHEGALTIVTLDHTEVGNALGGDAAAALADVFDDISLRSGTQRAVLLCAEGKHFCTGADLRGRRSDGTTSITGHMVRRLARTHHRAIGAVFNCRVPVVSAVQGAAWGFGLHLALAADLTIASETATFKEPFTDRGFNVDSGGSWLLPRLVGLTRAKQLLYLADTVDAPTAQDWGLVHRVVPADALDGAAREVASRLAARPTQALAATKALLHRGTEVTLEQAMHDESMAVELTIRSHDFREGMQAFVEKRTPEFDGT